jgi:hypothetical protein
VRARRTFGITYNNKIVLPRSVVASLGLSDDEADDVRAILADPFFAKIGMGKSPPGIAAAIVYLYLYIRRAKLVSLGNVCMAFHVTETCARARVKEILHVGGGQGVYWPTSHEYEPRTYFLSKVEKRVLALLPTCPPGITWTDVRVKSWNGRSKRETRRLNVFDSNENDLVLIPEYRHVMDGLVKHGYVMMGTHRTFDGRPLYWRVKDP